MPTELTSILTAAVALPAVLGLIWLAGRLARAGGMGMRRPNGAKGRGLALEETLALDQRRRLLLVRCEGRRVLLLTGGTDLVIGWLPPDPPA